MDNTAIRGGGLYAKLCTPLIVNCLIVDNVSSAYPGGGIFGRVLAYGCTITGNHAYPNGGGLAGDTSEAHVYNSILWGNQYGNASAAVISYSLVGGGWPGEGNLDANPLFVAPALGDFHIVGISPCLDGGDPAFQPLPGETDLDGQRRVWDGNGDGLPRVDMGWDEYGSFAYGDLNCDGAIGFGDINPFVLTLTDPTGYEALYPACDLLNADLNGDGTVGFGDINPFVQLLGAGPGLRP
jgi:hypothetical protein